jgi:hypothetical protein
MASDIAKPYQLNLKQRSCADGPSISIITLSLLPATQFVNHQLEVVHLQPVLYGSAGLDLERKAGVDITRHGLKNLRSIS